MALKHFVSKVVTISTPETAYDPERAARLLQPRMMLMGMIRMGGCPKGRIVVRKSFRGSADWTATKRAAAAARVACLAAAEAEMAAVTLPMAALEQIVLLNSPLLNFPLLNFPLLNFPGKSPGNSWQEVPFHAVEEFHFVVRFPIP